MNKERKIELLKELKDEASSIRYKTSDRKAVETNAKMLIRKIFGNRSDYLKDIDKIRYTMIAFTDATPASEFEKAFDRGREDLVNLISVMIKDVKLSEDENTDNSETSRFIIDSKKVFVVHGHNEEMKINIRSTLEQLDLEPIILHEQANKGRTIIEKFTDYSDVSAAIILLSADDKGYEKNEGVDKEKYRARQNVIFELGYFIGKLGRERVIALHEDVKNFDIPSDYSGVIFISYKEEECKNKINKELKEIGMNVDANKII